MEVIDNLAEAQITRPSLVTVGSYDGVHIGHQRLLGQMTLAARQRGYDAVVVTFHPRPQAVLQSHRRSLDLITLDEKARLLAEIGIDLLVVLHFDRELAQVPAAQFTADLVACLQMRELWLGAGSVLGRNREGDVPTLERLGKGMGFGVRAFDAVLCEDAPVSSTRIRQALMEGHIREATALLGRYPSLSGDVVLGAQRGRQMGFPTANIAVPSQLVLPPNGVYACYACLEGKCHPAATNVGTRPTFSNHERTVEAHIIGFSGDLYGQRLRLELVDHLRTEKRFRDSAALAAQIAADADAALRLLTQEDSAPRCPQTAG
jgi:riboflavin kinase/FMN adenylyltransferase